MTNARDRGDLAPPQGRQLSTIDTAAINVAGFGGLEPGILYGLLRLRVDVFVVEQECAYPELDGRDTEPGTRHLWITDDAGEPIAYLRILTEAEAETEPETGAGERRGSVARIGRVVVAKPARSGGHAARLMERALELVGDGPCVLEAQTYLVDFYRRFGFTPAGPEYVEDGIPHVPMRRSPA